MRPIPRLRWRLAGVLALASALNYLDRQSFPVVVGEIRKTVPISDQQYGDLTSLFLFAYALMYAGGGRLMDKLGTRAGYTLMVVWWSLADFMTGLVSSVAGLGACRFLLGMGEGGGFPGSAKAVAEWFPAKERSTACGIFNAGSGIGAVIAPPLTAILVPNFGWRSVFFVTGLLGFFWAWGWFFLYERPEKNRLISEPEQTYILEELAREKTGRETAGLPWVRLFGFREVWGLMLAKFLTDAAWYFFVFWLPKYLTDVRHLNVKQLGYFAWIPYAFGAMGSIGGGWLSSHLIRRGFTINAGRKIALATGASLLPLSLFIVASPLSLAIVFFSAAMFAHQFWSSNLQTLPADLFPASLVGSVGGLLGSAGSFGGMLLGLVVGRMIESKGYGPAFILAGVLHPLGFAVLLAMVKRIAPIRCG